MAKRSPQISMLANEKSAYGGELLKTRAGRSHGRPLSTRETMHLVLRSSKATGDWSFRRPRNAAHVNRIIDKFAVTYGVRVISMANVGNHLHLQIKLANRFTFKPFIRAVTAAIAMAVTGRNRWMQPANTAQPANAAPSAKSANTARSVESANAAPSAKSANTARSVESANAREKFWDYRPYTRVVESFKAWLTLKDYIKINEFEGAGYKRDDARFMLQVDRNFADSPG